MSVDEKSRVIGKPQSRVEGAFKVSGKAMYTADYAFPDMLYAVPVCATIAKGRVRSLSTKKAEAMPGVRAIYRHGTIGPLYRATFLKYEVLLDEKRPPLADEQIDYYGQYIAVAVADTFEQATAAADAVEAAYDADDALMNLDLMSGVELKQVENRGDAAKAFAAAPHKVDQVYTTPFETHSAIELHATVAVWKDNGVTLYDTVQGVGNHQIVMTQRLGLESENVRVITRNLGSGFGGKISAWGHCCLAAAAARKLNRPVKLVLSRRQAFESAGHRPMTEQRVRLSATAEGKLLSVQHDWANTTSMLDDFIEYCGEAAPYLYSVPNMRTSSGLARRTIGAPTTMRGPGAVPGSFALESAMDELAIQLKVDPVDLRLRNEPTIDESNGLPFSSRHLAECLTAGAQRFGWPRRTPAVGSMRKEGVTLGWGVAACSWGAGRFAAAATIELRADGRVRVACGTQDIGTGTSTILAQLVAERLAIPMQRIDVAVGDSALPSGPLSGGSLATASLVPAVEKALDDVSKRLINVLNAFPVKRWAGTPAENLKLTNGKVHAPAEPAETGLDFDRMLQQAGVRSVIGSGQSESSFGEKPKFSVHCFGAQFAEVMWEPEIARLRVSRTVTVIDSGRIINPKAARNQIVGSVMMGVGMALLEGTEYDARTGAAVNSNLADYMVTTHADAPEADVMFLEYPDLTINSLGAKGIGEIGMAGMAAAIANAVHHATGVRVRQLPIRIEDLLEPQSLGPSDRDRWPNQPKTDVHPQQRRLNDSPKTAS